MSLEEPHSLTSDRSNEKQPPESEKYASQHHSLSNNPHFKHEGLDDTDLADAELKDTEFKDSDKASDYKQADTIPTPHDMMNATPPTFKQKLQRFFYNKGLADMPVYMKEIYLSMPRYIYVNQDLPELMSYSNGYPVLTYARNKIRTTKYTPLTFLPKNLAYQFRNAANSYFLLLVILGAFQLFGVDSPGLAAVPLIVIVCITAVRDAFEDYRRSLSDYDLNNSPIHLLHGVKNSNVLKDNISGWRKFKKANSRVVRKITGGIAKACIMVFASKKSKQEYIRNQHQQEENALRRVSTIVSDASALENGYRSSFQGRTSIQTNRKSHQFSIKPQEISHSIINPEKIRENLGKDDEFKFKNRCWKDVSVGDFVRIRANEEIPADMIIVSVSDPEGNCFIETKNLDGETNLKMKKCLDVGGLNHLKHSNDLANTQFWVECDPPNTNLYSFKGTIHYADYDKDGNLLNPDEREPITNDHVLLRGSTLRNTKWAIGVVVYTGGESKIMLNSGVTPTKISRISRELNLSVFINFALLFILCFVSAVINGVFYDKSDTSRVFYEFKAYGSTAAINAIISFFVALIIYQSLIPISLYVSVEIIKTCQAFFIYSDIKMYYEKLDFPCVPKSWNISDDLGQVEYVFSDKTGTLTQNVMEFKKCTINGVSYGLAYTEAKQGLDKRNGVDIIQQQEMWKTKISKDREEMIDEITKYTNSDQFREENMTFVSSQYTKDTFIDEVTPQKEANEQFMLALALCHTVMTEANPEDETLRDFKAESPDEAALVAVARDVGIVFKERQRNMLKVEVYGEERTYELLETIAFTSARKRMSCFVKTPEGKILMLTKGADNVIFKLLAKESNSNTTSKTALHLEDFAKEGLRTLCITQKEVDESFFESWIKQYKDAKASISEDRDLLLDKLSDNIENNLVLLGGTAIEDRLQQGVPDSISILSQAGIKLWVLTGDRIETAINIGFSCNLLNNDMKLLVVRPDENDAENFDYVDQLVTNHLRDNFGVDVTPETLDSLVAAAVKDHSTPEKNMGLIIDGAALSHVFYEDIDGNIDEQHLLLRKKFLLLGKQCKSVICCRVSPAQKAQVVRLVKNELKVMTLAIGDGANDVAMIQSSDVGVGIAGEEGMQAVMSSDYAIGQFRFLTRLLLVHGRWSYKRLAEMVPCFFYKNVVFTFTCFWYGIYNNYDGSYLYEYTFLMFYNLAFTSLPIIFLAVFDQDASDTVSLLVPQLYRSGILRQDWSQIKFTWYMLDGFYQSVVAYFFTYLTYYVTFQDKDGLTVDHRFWQGLLCTAICVAACDIYVLLRQYRWDWLSLIFYAISILLVFFWGGVWSSRVYAQEFYRAGAQTFGTVTFWASLFIGVIVCLLPRFTYDFLKRNFSPRDIDIIRERVKLGEFDEYPQGYDPTDLEDVERHRLLAQLYKSDPEAFAKFERDLEARGSSESVHSNDSGNPFTRTFKTIKRKATIPRSRANTFRSRGNTLSKEMNNTFHKPIRLEELRAEMVRKGELSGAGLSRISTTHELPGLTHADTLLSYHTRTSINFEH